MDHCLHAPAAHTAPQRHYLRSWTGSPQAAAADGNAAEKTPAEDAAGVNRLQAGHAVRLRARRLSVLQIAHGRVWVTLTDAGPYSRVLAGDHFLSRGDSLTLLPGQELVMESFGSGHATSARFSWGPPGVAAPAPKPGNAAHWRVGVLQPLRDLRLAMGLAGGAAGRLVRGLGQVAGAALASVATGVAMNFVAARARKDGAKGTFDAACSKASVPCRPQ